MISLLLVPSGGYQCMHMNGLHIVYSSILPGLPDSHLASLMCAYLLAMLLAPCAVIMSAFGRARREMPHALHACLFHVCRYISRGVDCFAQGTCALAGPCHLSQCDMPMAM